MVASDLHCGVHHRVPPFLFLHSAERNPLLRKRADLGEREGYILHLSDDCSYRRPDLFYHGIVPPM